VNPLSRVFKGGPVPPSSSSSRTFPDNVKAGVRALFGEGLGDALE